MKFLKKAALVLIALILILAVTTFVVFQTEPFGGKFEGARLDRIQKSPEYKEGRFENDPPEVRPSLVDSLGYYKDQVREPQFEIPVIKIEPEYLKNPAAPGLRAFWFGHATVLVEVDGLRVMTDPILSEYASPFDIGPKRFHPPPISLDQLSNIDAVVISHDHYDHLDMKTVKHLAAGGTHFYVGLGIGAHLERWGIAPAQIHEMEWWESLELKGVKIHCTPARHYSGRKSRSNTTLWASWTVLGPKHSFFYSGDTGFGKHFKEIREKLGAVDLAIMKVGAYGIPWEDIHMNPERAVQGYINLRAKMMLPVHWATFNLSYHSWEEPILRTLAEAKDEGVPVTTPRIGELFDFEKPFQNTEWYKKEI